MKQRGFAPIAILLLVLVLGFLGYQAYKVFYPSKQCCMLPPSNLPSPSNISYSTTSLKVVVIPLVNMQLQLPSSLADKMIINEQKGTTGSSFNATFSDDFSLGGDTLNYSQPREGGFLDTSGYVIKNGKAYFIFIGSEREINTKEMTYEEITNPNGVRILKLKSKIQSFDGLGNPEEFTTNMIGALVNTKSRKYPGVAVRMTFNNGLTEQDFDRVLNSIKFTQ